MLILSRKRDEKIVMHNTRTGDLITMMVTDLQGGFKVRFGIDAPAHIAVHRLEVWNRIKEQREQREGGGE